MWFPLDGRGSARCPGTGPTEGSLEGEALAALVRALPMAVDSKLPAEGAGRGSRGAGLAAARTDTLKHISAPANPPVKPEFLVVGPKA